MKLEDLLGQFGLSLDELNAAERQTLNDWLGKLRSKQLTLPDVQEHLASLVSALEREIAGLETPPTLVSWLFASRRQLYLRARLKNYLMIQDFLLGPQRAEKWVTAQVQNLKPQ